MDVKEYAKKTFVAMKNPYNSVIRTFPNVINKVNEENESYYLGVKNIEKIPFPFLNRLEELNIYLHTIDKASFSGRAVDISLKNPITGRFMTGSSSGTALNVFIGINDIGLGTDGGGSVLAPAASLNLFGFIHPDLIKNDGVQRKTKISTDGISFTPSYGFILKDFYLLEKIMHSLLKIEILEQDETYLGLDEKIELNNLTGAIIEKVKMDDKYSASRVQLIENLNSLLSRYDVVVSKEGPVDVYGIGDTIVGHFDEKTAIIQQHGYKGYLRVVNMSSAVGLAIPSKDLSVTYLLMSKPDNKSVSKLFEIARHFIVPQDILLQRYFCNLDAYFNNGA